MFKFIFDIKNEVINEKYRHTELFYCAKNELLRIIFEK